MRVDLHNHTIPAAQNSVFARLRKAVPNTSEFYLQTIQQHRLDGLAVTNFHDVEVALALSREYPQYIIVGAEYQIILGESATAQMVVLGLDRNLHEEFMAARLQGIGRFAATAKAYRLPYFLVHLGWGIDAEHPRACEILDSVVANSIAVEVLNAGESEDMGFSSGIARYFGLAAIGGSNYLISQTGRRAYTRAPGSKTIGEFFEAIYHNRVEAGLTGGEEKLRKDYFRKMQKIWHTEIGWHREAVRRFGESLIFSLLDALPRHYQVQQQRRHQKKALRLMQRFADHLKIRETKRIFSVDAPISEKKKMWEQAIDHIYVCFPNR